MQIVWMVILIFLCLGAPLGARESAFSLPSLDRSAMAMASGEAGAYLSGLDALGTNPAGLSGAKREWNATYRQMPLDTNVSGTALSWPFASLRTTLAVSYSALRSADLERRTSTGDRAGTFQQEDQMMGLHGAHPFVLGGLEIVGGVSVKGIQSRVDHYSGTGLAVDLGLRHTFHGGPLTLAVSALNLGKGPKLLKERSALPTSFGISGTYQGRTPIAIFGGASYQSGQDISTISLGAEYRIGKIAAFRGHYAFGTGAEGNSGLGKMVGGIGVFLGNVRLDYAFQPAGEELSDAGAPATQHATLTLAF